MACDSSLSLETADASFRIFALAAPIKALEDKQVIQSQLKFFPLHEPEIPRWENRRGLFHFVAIMFRQ